MKNWLTRAREISGLTAQQCADAIDLPISEYAQVERHPGTLTLNELAALACAMGSAGQALIPSRITARQQPSGAKQALEAFLQPRRPTHRRQTIPPVSAHTSKPSLQAHAPTSEAPHTRAIQSARTPKQICNLLSRRASSKRFPATIMASSSQAFTCAETDTIEPACIGQGRRPRDARSRSRGARQAWAQRERQREHIKQKRLIPHSTPHSRRLLSRKRRPR